MKMPKNKDYDRRIFRLLFILNCLDRGKTVSTRELAEEFNVSLRTIQRDLEILNCAGFLIFSPEKGFHQFEEGFSLKKLHLTKEEASLLSFLYEVVSSLGENFKKSFQNILKKVIQKEYETPYYAKIPKGIPLKESYPFIKELEEAIDECQKIILTYEVDKQIKKYKLCPLKIIFFDGFWYLLSQKDKKKWILKFRLERIKEIEILDEYFIYPQNLKTILDESVNIWFSERKRQKAILKVDKDVADYFKQRQYFPEQKIKRETKDGKLIIETTVSDKMELVPTVLHWLPYVRIEEPEELNEELKKIIEVYLKKK